jgi:hypothetical protein
VYWVEICNPEILCFNNPASEAMSQSDFLQALTLLTCIREMNIKTCWDIDYPERSFPGLLHSLQTSPGQYLWLGNGRFLPNYFPYIIHLSPSHSTLYNLTQQFSVSVNASEFVLGRCPLRISTGTSTVMTEVLRGFARAFQINAGIVSYTRHCPFQFIVHFHQKLLATSWDILQTSCRPVVWDTAK